MRRWRWNIHRESSTNDDRAASFWTFIMWIMKMREKNGNRNCSRRAKLWTERTKNAKLTNERKKKKRREAEKKSARATVMYTHRRFGENEVKFCLPSQNETKKNVAYWTNGHKCFCFYVEVFFSMFQLTPFGVDNIVFIGIGLQHEAESANLTHSANLPNSIEYVDDDKTLKRKKKKKTKRKNERTKYILCTNSYGAAIRFCYSFSVSERIGFKYSIVNCWLIDTHNDYIDADDGGYGNGAYGKSLRNQFDSWLLNNSFLSLFFCLHLHIVTQISHRFFSDNFDRHKS